MACQGRQLFIAVLMLTAASSVILRGQSPQTPAPGQPPQPVFRSSVEAVQLSVIVTDAEGQPVSGLTEADFEIFENGVPVPISTFSAVDIPIERRDPRATVTDVLGNDGPQGRLYVIALDMMPIESAMRTRAILRRFVEEHFGPHDTAAVVWLTIGPKEAGQEFTNNPELLLNAIDGFDGGPTDDWSRRMREKNFIGDLKALMRFMSTLPAGRKALIFASVGVPLDAYDAVSNGPLRLGGFFSNVDTNFIDAISLATRNNIAFYPIDPRGMTTSVPAPGSFDTSVLESRMGLRGYAAVTGGFALTGSNNYDEAFTLLVRENSTYYLLAFNAGVTHRDARYVRHEVRVKRPGLRVRSTAGYIAPQDGPQRERRPATVLTSTWDAVKSAITTSGVPMRVYAAPFKGRDKNATVPIALEIAADKLNLVEEDGAHRGVLEVVFAVTDVKKKRWPVWRHRWGLALKPETYERVSTGAMRVVSQLSLPKGRYQLRASAGGAALAGSVVYDLEIPDFRKDFSLSGVALTSEQAQDTFTFSPDASIGVALPGPPTTAREFSRGDTLTIFAEAYEDRKKAHTVTFTLDLRDEAGNVIGRHAMERTAKDKPKQASVYAFAPTLSLEDVLPGRYVLHVDARSSLDRNKRVSRDLPFSVR